MAKSGFADTMLTTITKYPYTYYQNKPKDPTEQPDIDIRWHQIIDLLIDKKFHHNTSRYLVNQFIELLHERGVAMEKVNWELKEGLRSFQNLVAMLTEAITSLKIPVNRRATSFTYFGYYTKGNKLFIGIYLDKLDIVSVNTEVPLKKSVNMKVNPPIGKFENERWQNDLELSSEKIHFFARTKASQIECLEQFIKESVKFTKKLV